MANQGITLNPVISTKAEGRAEKSATVAAGVVFDDFCAWAAAEGLWGPENLSLIPGEVGASAVQNIGAYGVEAKDIIDTVHAFDRQERRFVDIPGADCGYGYRVATSSPPSPSASPPPPSPSWTTAVSARRWRRDSRSSRE